MARNPRRVLIVDDNVELAENIAEILQMDGHSTDVAASAEDALPKAVQAEPDVLLADFKLPGMNGVDLVRQFCATRTRVFAIVMSAYTDDVTVQTAREVGATFIPKPVDYELLVRWVRKGSA
jgi:DNA-binding response OmpR family regulator